MRPTAPVIIPLLACIALRGGSAAADDEGIPEDLQHVSGACLTISSYSDLGDGIRIAQGNGVLFSSTDSEGLVRLYAVTAGHAVEGCDFAVVTVRAPGIGHGSGRLELRLELPLSACRGSTGESWDMAALRLDGLLEDGSVDEASLAALALPAGDLSRDIPVEAGDTLSCLVRPVDPLLFHTFGSLSAVPGAVIDGPPGLSGIYLDITAARGFSGCPVFARSVTGAARARLAGLLVARFVDTSSGSFPVPGAWMFSDPLPPGTSFAEVVPASAVKSMLEEVTGLP